MKHVGIGVLMTAAALLSMPGASAYFVGGLGMTTLSSADGHMVVVPIRSGLGLRLGVNLGYLKFTESPTWNPF